MVRASRFIVGVVASLCLWAPSVAFTTGEARESGSATTDAQLVATASDLRLRVPSAAKMGARITSMDQIGSIPVSVGVSRLDNGQVLVGPNLWDGKGLRFPAYDSSSSPPRAVVRITHTARSGDPLAPRSNDFKFSIYFKKDARSSGSPVDDGDNLMQRGLYTDPAQYKLQVDDGRPSCVIRGDRGRVIVRSSVSVDPSLWYHAQCTKRGNTITLTVKEYRADGTTRSVTTRKSGATGSLVWPRRETPIAIGGKLLADGQIVRSTTDQFNGWATHPLLEINN